MARWIELAQKDIDEKARQPTQVGPAVLKDGRKAGRQHKPSGVRAAASKLAASSAGASEVGRTSIGADRSAALPIAAVFIS